MTRFFTRLLDHDEVMFVLVPMLVMGLFVRVSVSIWFFLERVF